MSEVWTCPGCGVLIPHECTEAMTPAGGKQEWHSPGPWRQLLSRIQSLERELEQVRAELEAAHIAGRGISEQNNGLRAGQEAMLRELETAKAALGISVAGLEAIADYTRQLTWRKPESLAGYAEAVLMQLGELRHAALLSPQQPSAWDRMNKDALEIHR